MAEHTSRDRVLLLKGEKMNTLYETENILKNFFLAEASEAFNSVNPFLSIVKRTTSDVWGKDIHKIVKTEKDNYLIFRSELKNLYAKIEIPENILGLSLDRKIKIIGEKIVSAKDEYEKTIAEQLYIGCKNGVTGFDKIFSGDGELYGNNKNDYSFLVPYEEDNVGELTLDLILRKINFLEQRNGKSINFILCSLPTRTSIFSRSPNFTAQTIKFGKTNLQAISINGVPLVCDNNCKNGVMYFLNTDDFSIHQLCDWQWLENDDGHILRESVSKKTYTATLVKYADLICSRPCEQAILTGIAL